MSRFKCKIFDDPIPELDFIFSHNTVSLSRILKSISLDYTKLYSTDEFEKALDSAVQDSSIFEKWILYLDKSEYSDGVGRYGLRFKKEEYKLAFALKNL